VLFISRGKELPVADDRDVEGELCSACGSTLTVDARRGMLVCQTCGLVESDHYIDQGQEWRAFDGKQVRDRVRTGAPPTLMVHDKGLSTVIDKHNIDGRGKQISPRKRADINRLRKWDHRSKTNTSVDRNLSQALVELDRLGSVLHINKPIREATAKLYRKAMKKGLIQGRSIVAMVAACLFIMCKLFKIPKSLAELCKETDADEKKIVNSFKILCITFKLSIAPLDPAALVSKIASELDLGEYAIEVEKKTKKLLQFANNRQVVAGKDPNGMAAAAIWLVSKLLHLPRLKVTQKRVAEIAGVTETTVRNRYKGLVKDLKISIP